MKWSIPKKCRNDIPDMRTVPKRNKGGRFGCRETLNFSSVTAGAPSDCLESPAAGRLFRGFPK